jgi:hypothetical protein
MRAPNVTDSQHLPGRTGVSTNCRGLSLTELHSLLAMAAGFCCGAETGLDGAQPPLVTSLIRAPARLCLSGLRGKLSLSMATMSRVTTGPGLRGALLGNEQHRRTRPASQTADNRQSRTPPWHLRRCAPVETDHRALRPDAPCDLLAHWRRHPQPTKSARA